MLRGIVRLTGILVALVAVGSVSACMAAEKERAPSPAPSSSASRTVDSEQLTREARGVYAKYLVAVEAVAERGTSKYGQLKPLLAAKAYEAEVKSFESQEAKGLRTAGPSRLTRFKVQRIDELSHVMSAYACVDFSEVRVMDKSGKDITPTTRPDRQTFLSSFRIDHESLTLMENGTWGGASIC